MDFMNENDKNNYFSTLYNDMACDGTALTTTQARNLDVLEIEDILRPLETSRNAVRLFLLPIDIELALEHNAICHQETKTSFQTYLHTYLQNALKALACLLDRRLFVKSTT